MLNPALDWQRFRWPRSIIMTSVRTSNPPNVVFTVANAFRGVCSYKILQSATPYVRPEATYLIPKDVSNSGGAGPFKPGDLLTDELEIDATDINSHSPEIPEQRNDAVPITYTVWTATNDEFYYLLSVFNPKITFNLRDLVDIVPLTQSVSTILTRNTTDGTVIANQICRRQPTDLRMATLQGRQGDMRMLDVFFATAQTLSPKTHVLRWTEGASTIIADIVSVTNAERIDELQRVSVKVQP